MGERVEMQKHELPIEGKDIHRSHGIYCEDQEERRLQFFRADSVYQKSACDGERSLSLDDAVRCHNEK